MAQNKTPPPDYYTLENVVQLLSSRIGFEPSNSDIFRWLRDGSLKASVLIPNNATDQFRQITYVEHRKILGASLSKLLAGKAGLTTQSLRLINQKSCPAISDSKNNPSGRFFKIPETAFENRYENSETSSLKGREYYCTSNFANDRDTSLNIINFSTPASLAGTLNQQPYPVVWILLDFYHKGASKEEIAFYTQYDLQRENPMATMILCEAYFMRSHFESFLQNTPNLSQETSRKSPKDRKSGSSAKSTIAKRAQKTRNILSSERFDLSKPIKSHTKQQLWRFLNQHDSALFPLTINGQTTSETTIKRTFQAANLKFR